MSKEIQKGEKALMELREQYWVLNARIQIQSGGLLLFIVGVWGENLWWRAVFAVLGCLAIWVSQRVALKYAEAKAVELDEGKDKS